MKQRSGHLQGFQAGDEQGRAVPCAFCMCQTAGQQPPGRACWWVSGCRGSTRRGGLWPRLLRLQRKKKKNLFFFEPSEILSCCFAEVGACAAPCSLKNCPALGLLCSAPRPHNPAARAPALVKSPG